MATTDGMLVNHAALDQAADDLVTAVKNIQNRMQQLEQELKPLQSDWEGDAQQAYNTAKAKWDGAIDEMVAILQSTSTAVHQSNGEYQAADTRGAHSFQIG